MVIKKGRGPRPPGSLRVDGQGGWRALVYARPCSQSEATGRWRHGMRTSPTPRTRAAGVGPESVTEKSLRARADTGVITFIWFDKNTATCVRNPEKNPPSIGLCYFNSHLLPITLPHIRWPLPGPVAPRLFAQTWLALEMDPRLVRLIVPPFSIQKKPKESLPAPPLA